MAVLTASPVPQSVREVGASQRSQDRPLSSATHTSDPAHPSLSPVPQSVPEQSTSCSCSIPKC